MSLLARCGSAFVYKDMYPLPVTPCIYEVTLEIEDIDKYNALSYPLTNVFNICVDFHKTIDCCNP